MLFSFHISTVENWKVIPTANTDGEVIPMTKKTVAMTARKEVYDDWDDGDGDGRVDNDRTGVGGG